MAQNRLRLNFQLPDVESRRIFLESYLASDQFKKRPLTEDELEMCGNYLLWGKEADGKNSVQHKEVYIDSKNSPWTTEPDHDSLDELLEIPTFNENLIRWPHSTQYTTPKQTFSREEALANAPSLVRETYTELFREIDETELLINFYELQIGKRKNPPRSELLERFSPTERAALREAATHLNNYSYLKKRHLLVELRRQQYTLKDSYSPVLFFENTREPQILKEPVRFGADIYVRPLGLLGDDRRSLLVFQDLDNLQVDLSEQDLQLISQLVWYKDTDSIATFDFENLEHVYQLFLLYFEIQDEVERNQSDYDESLRKLITTLHYYIKHADLTESQREILKMKVQRKHNSEISQYINEKYGKTYTDNYISTIFRQKIIKAINEAATYHKQVISTIFFPEEFKKCNTCGRLLLKDPHNFVRKNRAKDGYTNRCKNCDRIARQQLKVKPKETSQ